MPDQPHLLTDKFAETAEDKARRAEYRERLCRH